MFKLNGMLKELPGRLRELVEFVNDWDFPIGTSVDLKKAAKIIEEVIEKQPVTKDGYIVLDGEELYSDNKNTMFGVSVKTDAYYIVDSGKDSGQHVVDAVDRYYADKENIKEE